MIHAPVILSTPLSTFPSHSFLSADTAIRPEGTSHTNAAFNGKKKTEDAVEGEGGGNVNQELLEETEMRSMMWKIEEREQKREK